MHETGQEIAVKLLFFVVFLERERLLWVFKYSDCPDQDLAFRMLQCDNLRGSQPRNILDATCVHTSPDGTQCLDWKSANTF